MVAIHGQSEIEVKVILWQKKYDFKENLHISNRDRVSNEIVLNKLDLKSAINFITPFLLVIFISHKMKELVKIYRNLEKYIPK